MVASRVAIISAAIVLITVACLLSVPTKGYSFSFLTSHHAAGCFSGRVPAVARGTTRTARTRMSVNEGSGAGEGGIDVGLQEKLEKFFTMTATFDDPPAIMKYQHDNPDLTNWLADNLSHPGKTGKGRFEDALIAFMGKVNEAVCHGIVKEIPLHQGASVLELGPGGGVSFIACAERLQSLGGGKISGADVSDLSVKDTGEAAAKLQLGDVQWEVVKGGAGLPEQPLPFPDNSFDIIYHTNCWYFWPDLAFGCKDCLRVLKPGGITYSGSKLSSLQSFMGPNIDLIKDRFLNIELDGLEQCLQSAGFIDVKSAETETENVFAQFTLTTATKPPL